MKEGYLVQSGWGGVSCQRIFLRGDTGMNLFIIIKKCFFILTWGHFFIAFRKRRRERGKERETSMWERSIDLLPPIHTTTGDPAHNPVMCSDWESNLQPFGYGMTFQPTELHWAGPALLTYLKFIVKFIFQL